MQWMMNSKEGEPARGFYSVESGEALPLREQVANLRAYEALLRSSLAEEFRTVPEENRWMLDSSGSPELSVRDRLDPWAVLVLEYWLRSGRNDGKVVSDLNRKAGKIGFRSFDDMRSFCWALLWFPSSAAEVRDVPANYEPTPEFCTGDFRRGLDDEFAPIARDVRQLGATYRGRLVSMLTVWEENKSVRMFHQFTAAVKYRELRGETSARAELSNWLINFRDLDRVEIYRSRLTE